MVAKSLAADGMDSRLGIDKKSRMIRRPSYTLAWSCCMTEYEVQFG